MNKKSVYTRLAVVTVGALAIAGLSVTGSSAAVTSNSVTSGSATSSSATSTSEIAVQFTTVNPLTGIVTPSPANCWLYASVVHLRSGLPINVGSKPYTNCDYAVASIHQDTTTYKDGYFGREQQGPVIGGGNTWQATYTQMNIVVPCTNTIMTNWFAITNLTMVEDGIYYFATVQTPTSPIPCGT